MFTKKLEAKKKQGGGDELHIILSDWANLRTIFFQRQYGPNCDDVTSTMTHSTFYYSIRSKSESWHWDT